MKRPNIAQLVGNGRRMRRRQRSRRVEGRHRQTEGRFEQPHGSPQGSQRPRRPNGPETHGSGRPGRPVEAMLLLVDAMLLLV